jgi:hypothetical protein
MPIRFAVRLSCMPAIVFLALAIAWLAPQASFAQTVVREHSLSQWEHELQADLIGEKFDDLDRTADQLRTEKSRFPGGEWQLYHFYTALDAPQQTEKDSAEHIAHLQHWMSQRPNSITAPVALATALTRWAWVARGHGYANTVTPEGWRLFGERMNEALEVLQGSEKMSVMCPQWYSAMLAVGTAQGWNRDRMHNVLDDGISLEPGYYYLYRQYANYLLPKWHGRPGDASSFALASADAVGGDAGDILYFEIGTELIKRGNDEFPAHEMDWERLQRGYQALVSQSGRDGYRANQLAYMSWKFQDSTVARKQFELIGDAWNRIVWANRNYFDRARDWAQSPTTGLLPGQGQAPLPVIR